MPKRNQDEIKDKHKALKDMWALTHQKWVSKIDPYLGGTFEVWDKSKSERAAAFPQYRPSTGWAEFSHARNRMTTMEPRASRLVWGESEKRQKTADKKVEPWLNGGLRYMAALDAALVECWANGMRYGYWILEGPIVDGKARSAYRDGLKTYWPARWSAPHPATVLANIFDGMVPDEVFVFKVMRARDLHDLTLDVKTNRTMEDSTIYQGLKLEEWVKVGELWTSEDHTLFLMGSGAQAAQSDRVASDTEVGEVFYTEPNKLEYMPFTQSVSGWGAVKASASVNEAVSQMCEGVIDHILEDILTTAQTLTAEKHIHIENAFLPDETQEDPGRLEQEMNTSRFLQTRVKDSIQRIPPKQVSPGLQAFGERIDRIIEGATYSKQVGGYPVPSVNTVGATAINLGEANKQFHVPKGRLTQCVTRFASNLLRLQEKMIDIYKEPMVINGHTLSKVDIEEDYGVEVELAVTDIVMQNQQIELYAGLQTRGQVSMKYLWKQAGVENVAEMEEGLLDDILMRSEEVMAEELAQRAKAKGLKLAAKNLMAKARRLAAQREAMEQAQEMGVLGPGAGGNGNGGMPTGEEVPMPSDTPSNPIRDTGPAGQLRRQRKGLTPETAKPAPRANVAMEAM